MDSHKSISKNILGVEQSPTLAINERVAKLRSEGRVVYNMGLGQSPFPVPDNVVQTLRDNAGEKDYLPGKGLPALCREVASYHKRKNNLEVKGENILIGPGSKELLFILQLVFDGEIVIPTPSWVSYAPQARIAQKTIRLLDTSHDNRWVLDHQKIRELYKNDNGKKVSRVLILNYPGNPTGLTYKKEELRAIAEVAREYGMLVLSDEIYGDLNFNGDHTSIAEFYPEGTIVSSGLSKWCGAGGWRLGTFAFPEELEWLLDAMVAVASETFTSVSAPIQHAAIEAFKENEEIDDYLFQVRRILSCLSLECSKILKNAKINIHNPEGAFYLFPDFSPHAEALNRAGIEKSTILAKRILEEAGVATLPASDFNRPEKEFMLRMSIVNFDGKKALSAARNISYDKNLPDDFCEKHCGETVEGVKRLAEWVNALYNEASVLFENTTSERG